MKVNQLIHYSVGAHVNLIRNLQGSEEINGVQLMDIFVVNLYLNQIVSTHQAKVVGIINITDHVDMILK